MFKRLGAFLLALAFAAPASAQVTNALTRFGIGGIPECKDSRVFCVGKQAGAEYSVISDATCTTESATSAAGSAVKAAVDSGLCSASNPCTIKVGRGVYQECVSIDNITDLTIVGDGMYDTIIRPSVTTATDVAGGVIRIANATATRNATARIEVAHLTAWNDAWSPPEAGIQVGREAGPTATGTAANWNDVIIRNVRAIGHHDGIQWFGSELSTDDDPPRITVVNNVTYSAGDSYTAKGFSNFTVSDNLAIGWTNFCETTNTTALAAISGAVQSGAAGMFTLEAADDPGTTDILVGRKVTFSDNGGGPCGATDACDGLQGWITDYDTSTDTATFTVACSEAIDTGCSYAIDAVKHNDGTDYVAGDAIDSPCTDVDWTTIAAGGIFQGFWKQSWFHFGTDNTVPTDAPDAAVGRVTNLRGVTYINDRGPANAQACTAQAWVAGLLAYQSTWETVEVSGLTGTINVNADLRDNLTCAEPIAGVALSGAVRFDGPLSVRDVSITINNRGDADENIACAVANTTTNDGADPADTLRLDDFYCAVNNTVGSYAGTTTTLVQASNGVMVVGSVTSPDAITTSGTINHLATMDAGLSGSVAEDLADPAGACIEGSAITVTGAALGNFCTVGTSAALPAGVGASCRVTASNTVKVSLCGTGDPASMTYTVRTRQ